MRSQAMTLNAEGVYGGPEAAVGAGNVWKDEYFVRTVGDNRAFYGFHPMSERVFPQPARSCNILSIVVTHKRKDRSCASLSPV